MDYYCGIDVSLEQSSFCCGQRFGCDRAESHGFQRTRSADRLAFKFGVSLSRIGLEADPLLQWLYAGLAKGGFMVDLLETRHVREAFKAMPVKTDRKDARGIARLM